MQWLGHALVSIDSKNGALGLILAIFLGCQPYHATYLMPSGLLIQTKSRLISLEYVEELVLFVAKQRGIPVERVGHLNIDIVFGYFVDCLGYMATGCYIATEN